MRQGHRTKEKLKDKIKMLESRCIGLLNKIKQWEARGNIGQANTHRIRWNGVGGPSYLCSEVCNIHMFFSVSLFLSIFLYLNSFLLMVWLLRQVDVNQGDSIRYEAKYIWLIYMFAIQERCRGKLAWPIPVACQLASRATMDLIWISGQRKCGTIMEVDWGPWDYLVSGMPSIYLVYHGF